MVVDIAIQVVQPALCDEGFRCDDCRGDNGMVDSEDTLMRSRVRSYGTGDFCWCA